MRQPTLEFLAEQVALSEQLWARKDTMLQPQDLPGRYGRVVRAVDHVLQTMDCACVLAGGWAVWRHGYYGRMTQDLDIVVPADRIEELLRVASVSGFEILPVTTGRWPKFLHKDTDVMVVILPEGGTPGTAPQPAPTKIPHPSKLGAAGSSLRYIQLPALIELKLAAARARDEADVIELVRANPDAVDEIRQHLSNVHPDYVVKIDNLIRRAHEQRDQ